MKPVYKSIIFAGGLLTIGFILLVVPSRFHAASLPTITPTASGTVIIPTATIQVFFDHRSDTESNNKVRAMEANSFVNQVVKPKNTKIPLPSSPSPSNDAPKITDTKLELPDGIIFPIPHELPLLSSPLPFRSAVIELKGHKYEEVSTSIMQVDKRFTTIPLTIGYNSFSPNLTPDIYYRNEYCPKNQEHITHEMIKGQAITVIRDYCGGLGLWFDYRSKTIGLRVNSGNSVEDKSIDKSSDYLTYLKIFAAQLLEINRQENAGGS